MTDHQSRSNPESAPATEVLTPRRLPSMEIILRPTETITITDIPQDDPPLGPQEDDGIRRTIAYVCLTLFTGTVIYGFIAAGIGGDLWARSQVIVLAVMSALALVLGPLAGFYFVRK